MLESRQIRGATTLNRRNKTALCATLACVGLILLLGGGMRTAVGVGFLGASFSWALGSNYRPLHWLFVASGVLLLIPVVVDGFLWPRNKADLIKSDTDLVQGDRDYLKTTLAPRAQDYSDKKDWERDWSQYLKDESQHRNEFFKDEEELRKDQAEGTIRHILKSDWGMLLGGILLLSAGAGLVLCVKPLRQSTPPL